MKRIVVSIVLMFMFVPAIAQDGGRTLKPNYRRIARVVADPHGEYFYDSVEERFARCDTSLTVDHLRCLYYADTLHTLRAAHRRYQLLASRFGPASRRAGDAWWQYQMLLTAVWSSGDGSRRRPLHVRLRSEADFLRESGEVPADARFRIHR